ncbi:rab GTPase-binding effector protein 2-like [Scyliorhinus torazame]
MERGGSEPPAGDPMASNVEALRLQLSEALAENENIKAIATVSESTKQEAIAQVKRQCQEEVASLQTIMKESMCNYESQLENMERERFQWRQYEDSKEREVMKLRRQLLGNLPPDNLENEMTKAQQDAERLRSIVMPMEQEIASLKEKLAKAEEQLSAESPPAPHRWDAELTWREEPAGPPRRHPKEWDPEDCDSGSDSQVADTWMTASGPAPGPVRPVPAGKEDTASLLSTGTLVPESIYLPPPGHHLLLDEEWNELQQEVKQHELSLHQTGEQLEREKMVRKNLEEALRQSSEDCVQEIALLKEKVDSSAFEVQTIKELFTETQRRTQRQMVQVMVTQKELSQQNRLLLRENQSLKLYPSLWNKAEDCPNPATGQGVRVLPAQSVCPEENAASPVCEEPHAPGAGPSPDRSSEVRQQHHASDTLG